MKYKCASSDPQKCSNSYVNIGDGQTYCRLEDNGGVSYCFFKYISDTDDTDDTEPPKAKDAPPIKEESENAINELEL